MKDRLDFIKEWVTALFGEYSNKDMSTTGIGGDGSSSGSNSGASSSSSSSSGGKASCSY